MKHTLRIMTRSSEEIEVHESNIDDGRIFRAQR
jgi:hypothetical protein